MKRSFFLGLFFASCGNFCANSRPQKLPKIVGLMAVRNESAIIIPALRAMAEYADAIVVLDDASEDNTLAIIESLVQECNIERIISKKKWIRDERADKNRLLYSGREIGGTHFILLDADEMFTANCMRDNWLRRRVFSLRPGQVVKFPMMNLWDGVDTYRYDYLCNPRIWKWRGIVGLFCDDGECNYDDNPSWGPSGNMHISRAPANRKKGNYSPDILVTDLNLGLLHFKSVNLEDIEVKKVWYMCLEFINANREANSLADTKENAEKINAFYHNEYASILCDQSHIKLSPVPDAWVAYPWFDRTFFKRVNPHRKNDILRWLKTYGPNYFASLHIWDIDWIRVFKR